LLRTTSAHSKLVLASILTYMMISWLSLTALSIQINVPFQHKGTRSCV